MSGVVLSPNLPAEKARAVIIGQRYETALRGPLENLGLRVILCPPNPMVDGRLSGHVDLSVVHIGGKDMLISRHVARDSFLYELEEMEMEPRFCDSPSGPQYPQDAAMCAAFIGKYVFHNPRISCPELLEAAGERLIHVRQGYAKCALCPVSESAAVTSDGGIASAARRAGLDILLISQGHIFLEGFDYGFIGGSTFCVSDRLLAFTGSLSLHPHERQILDFLEKQDISPVYLTEGAIFDIGSAIPI